MPSKRTEHRHAAVVMPAEICSMKRKDGEPCTGFAIRGTVPAMCKHHGGKLPYNRLKAARKVEEAKIALAGILPLAVQTMKDTMLERKTNPGLALRASEIVAKYGLGEMVSIAMTVETKEQKEEAARVKVQGQLDDLRDRELERQARYDEAYADRIVPGDVVDGSVDDGPGGPLAIYPMLPARLAGGGAA